MGEYFILMQKPVPWIDSNEYQFNKEPAVNNEFSQKNTLRYDWQRISKL